MSAPAWPVTARTVDEWRRRQRVVTHDSAARQTSDSADKTLVAEFKSGHEYVAERGADGVLRIYHVGEDGMLGTLNMRTGDGKTDNTPQQLAALNSINARFWRPR